MAFQVVLELRVIPESTSALKQWLNENLPATQSCDGCISVQALQHDADTSRILVIGLWQSRAKWETYIKWREDRGDFRALAPMLQAQPHFECYKQFGEWKNAS